MQDNINHSVTITRLEESDHSLEAEQDQCKVHLECQEISMLKEENSMLKSENTILKSENSHLKEENSMLKEKFKQLHKLMDAHTGKILYWMDG